jgi:hypothetical protein
VLKIWTEFDEETKIFTVHSTLKSVSCHTNFELDIEITPMDMLGDIIIPVLINHVEQLENALKVIELNEEKIDANED